MPDAHGNFKGMTVPADAWERIFGRRNHAVITNVTTDIPLRDVDHPNRDNRPTDK